MIVFIFATIMQTSDRVLRLNPHAVLPNWDQFCQDPGESSSK